MAEALEPLFAGLLASEAVDFSGRGGWKKRGPRQNRISPSVLVQKRRNAKQGGSASEAQDVVVGDVEVYKGLRKRLSPVRKDRRKQGVNTENTGQYRVEIFKNTLDTL